MHAASQLTDNNIPDGLSLSFLWYSGGIQNPILIHDAQSCSILENVPVSSLLCDDSLYLILAACNTFFNTYFFNRPYHDNYCMLLN